MTPPKSVENPLSNKSSMFTSTTTTTQTATSSATPAISSTTTSSTTSSSVHYSSNSATNMPPISYDDLNNIFEEESSADEQQQQQQHQQNIGVMSSMDENATTTATSLAAPASQNSANFPVPPAINSIQATLSVVMTPPSQEVITNGIGSINSNNPSVFNTMDYYEDMQALSNEDSNASSATAAALITSDQPNLSEFTSQAKTLKLNDYNTIINNKKRPLFTNLLSTQPNPEANSTTTTTSTDVFDIPALNKFTRNTKYKRVNLSVQQQQTLKSVKYALVNKSKSFQLVKKLKWNLSTAGSSSTTNQKPLFVRNNGLAKK